MTAKEFLIKYPMSVSGDWIIRAMIEFAKLKVKEALDQVYEESKHGDQEHQDWLRDKFNSYNYNSII